MECLHCKGLMTRGVTPFHLDRKGCHVQWDAVPAWICTQCGEPYFEAREVRILQEVARSLDRQEEALLAEAV
ncbi:MAG: YgiT-type zinc finger protein [Thermoanaerobaculia bacterium]|nr:YgiT-type zinc finger protein [Thermoanaerobaculia bacterium]